MTEAQAFASALFGSAPEGLHTLFWTLQDRRSHWVSRGDGGHAVAQRAEALAQTQMDTYISVSAAASRGKSNARISSKESAGIMGLWADVDIADADVHKKWNLPPDEKAAMDLLDRAGVEPSLIIHSGHGLQAWWLFPEFWTFESEAERQQAADLAERWNTTLRVRAAEKDWTVDSTFDLARVMRVPGTLNYKKATPVPVRLMHDSGQRYTAEAFDGFFVGESYLAELGIRPTREYVVGDLDLNEANRPDPELFEALLSNSDLFAATWNRTRRDFRDQSGSVYDLSLASQAVQAGWIDQDIASLILMHRRKHRDQPEKALRQDYIRRTIAKAREDSARTRAAETMDDAVHELRTVRLGGDDESIKDARRSTLDSISQQIGVETLGIIKYTSDPPTYRMITATASVDLGGIEGISQWNKFRDSVAAATDHYIPRFKQHQWDKIAQAILDSAEKQDVGMEATQEGQVYLWLHDYLQQRQPTTDIEESATTEYPYLVNGKVHIFGPAFRRWLWLGKGERVSARDLGKMLRVYGCSPAKLNVDIDGSRTTRSTWALPDRHSGVRA